MVRKLNINEAFEKLLLLSEDKYFIKVAEELAECQVAITHYNDKKAGLMEVVDEIADVYLQLEKIKFHLAKKEQINIDVLVEKKLKFKTSNLIDIAKAL